ncbi:gas vesicle protein GvpJ [Streptomyces violaceusniger]|uniref:gas vesicle protein GvpJ n=1 Tax=Streptomyces violaceusniger TaxID=68280 RepID=UPI000997137E|nr:gas vesicle protein GvpJ [Streptomyces hygroscopicus]AQW52974.1 gas vesicle protein [Streptomyces hygroscopicus]
MPTGTYTEEVVCVQRTGTLYDVLELILDRGMVIDVFIRVSLVGIEILKIDARIVVASVDTYLRFAEACNRLDLEFDRSSTTVPELLGGVAGGGGSPAGRMATGLGKKKAKKAVKGVGEKVKHAVGVGDDEDEEEWEEQEEQESRPRRRTTAGGGARRRSASSEED